MDRWTELRTAYQVARLGTISAAATALGFHRATVNRHIDLLEDELGARIFIRHARGYSLTELGEDVLRVAQKTEELVDDLAGRARGGHRSIEGEIKVTILPPFAELLMAPAVRFRQENPNCKVSIIVSEDLARLEYGEAHIALRAGAKPDHPDYVVSEFKRVGLNLYAHDRYVQRKGMPRSPRDLSAHEFVVHSEPTGRLPFHQWLADTVRPPQIALSSTNTNVLSEAVFAGMGLGFLSDVDAAGREDVHPVLPPNRDWYVSLWLVTHVDLHRTEKVQAMLTCLRAIGS